MQRKSLLVSALALLIAGSAAFAIAQDGAPNAPMAGSKGASAGRGPQMGRGDDGFRGGPDFGRGFGGQGSPVIDDLSALERLYLTSGRSKELPALYNEVLSKSQDPRVRTYVYHQLARTQSAPANPDQAIATLRKSLDENLANEARQRAEFEKMRSDWEQHRSQVKPAPAPAAQP